jgi:hypothetical protein
MLITMNSRNIGRRQSGNCDGTLLARQRSAVSHGFGITGKTQDSWHKILAVESFYTDFG